MIPLLLLAMMQVPDSTIVDVQVIRGPAQTITVRDTTPAAVDLTVHLVSDTVGVNERLHAYMASCGCVSSGPPDWFWAGTLVLGVAGLIVWAGRESTTITVEQSQEQDQTTTTETKHGWIWPWPKKKKGHHE